MGEQRPGGFVPFGQSANERPPERRQTGRVPILRPERERGVVPFDEAARGLADDELRNRRR